MSQLLVQTYLNDLSDLKRVSGSVRESVVREAFKTLLKNWGRGEDLIFVLEYEIETPDKQRRYVDGALLSEIRWLILERSASISRRRCWRLVTRADSAW